MKFKAILFDFDGLMFDTEKLWQTYYYKANDVFNVNFTEEDRISIVGKNEETIRKTLKAAFPTLDVDEYRDWLRKEVLHHQMNLLVDAKKGLIDLLSFAEKKNIKTAIVSGSEKSVIENVLNKAKININDFQTMVTGDMKVNPKPNPDVYLLACKNLGVKPEEAIVLEDSYNGVKAGQRAGCYTIMIPDTFPVTDEMKETADLILNDLTEVITLLERT